MSEDNGNWIENKKLVLNYLEELAEKIEKLDSKLDQINAKLEPMVIDLNGLKVKAGVVGFLTGLIAPFVTLMFLLFKQLFTSSSHQ